MAGTRKVVLFAFAWAVAAVFLYAGALKLMRPDALLVDIISYHLVPYRIAYLAAYLLPAIEIVSGLALFFSATRREAASILAILTAVFTVALLSAWVRDLDISCGCFGKSDTVANYPWLIGRDMLILGGCLAIISLSSSET